MSDKTKAFRPGPKSRKRKHVFESSSSSDEDSKKSSSKKTVAMSTEPKMSVRIREYLSKMQDKVSKRQTIIFPIIRIFKKQGVQFFMLMEFICRG